MSYIEAIKLYRETFEEGPPIFGMEEQEALVCMLKAIESGKAMKQGTEKNIPKDAYL